MSTLIRTGISLESDLLERFDRVIHKKGYKNRSEAIRDLVRDYAVGGYPATFLIDSGGMIVSNLRLSGADAYRTVAAALGDTASMMSFIAGGNQKFRFAGEMRGSVEVEGDFSGWRRLPLYWSGSEFVRGVTLSPGRYHYRFIVDGSPVLDPSNPETEDAPPGKAANVLTLR